MADDIDDFLIAGILGKVDAAAVALRREFPGLSEDQNFYRKLVIVVLEATKGPQQ